MSNPLAASKVSSALLVAVTVWAFWNLQNSGPEGTLRRFFELAGDSNWAELNRALIPSDEQLDSLTIPEQILIREAHRIGSIGSYRAVPLKSGPRAAVIAVQVDDPQYGLLTTTWVLTRPSLRWTVDLKSTVIAQTRIGTNIAKEPLGPHSGLMDRF